MLITEPFALAVTAAVVITSFPAARTIPDPAVLAVIAALTSTSFPALSVRVRGVVQVTALVTVMSFVAIIDRSELAKLVVTLAGVSSPPAVAIV